MGAAAVADFARLYTAPGVDHVGSGAPANVDMLSVLVDWVEQGHARPAISWLPSRRSRDPSQPSARCHCASGPHWPRYKQGDPKVAASFVCAP